MGRKRMLESTSDINALASHLAKSDRVNRFDTGDDKECGTLAFCLSELERSCIVLVDEHLPKLLRKNIGHEEIEETLFHIALELRNILYQMKEPNYFRYMLEEYEEQ